MRFKFTIARRLSLGFGVLILFVIVVFYFSTSTLNKSIEISDRIMNQISPSVSDLEGLKFKLIHSQKLVYNIAYVPLYKEDPVRIKLRNFHKEDYPLLREKILKHSELWEEDERLRVDTIFSKIDVLIEKYVEIESLLPNWHSHEDPMNVFTVTFLIGDDGEVTTISKEIIFLLDELLSKKKNILNSVTEKMQDSFGFLQSVLRNLGLALMLGGIVIAYYTIRSIINPIYRLKMVISDLGKGITPEGEIEEGNDEVGEMAKALNKLINGLTRQQEFANAIGMANFKSDYEPLSSQDKLGFALLKMRDDLAENERILERKVKERTREVVRQKEEIEKQTFKIHELYKEVTASIRYAKRLQQAILPAKGYVDNLFPDNFILYMPKDIVSGDFYWVAEKGSKRFIAAVDCTGHGVPGAFMSILGYNGLNAAVAKYDEPGKILDDLNMTIYNTLHNDGEMSAQDGMDIALCCVDYEKGELQYSGAFNPLYIIREDQIIATKATKSPIGTDPAENEGFVNHKFTLEEGDQIYIFSDGYADQFGGPRGKKFMHRRFRILLLSLIGKTPEMQKQVLYESVNRWKGALDQVDDILVMGLQFNRLKK